MSSVIQRDGAQSVAVPSRKDIQASIMEAELRTTRGRVEGSEAAWITEGLQIEEQKYVHERDDVL